MAWSTLPSRTRLATSATVAMTSPWAPDALDDLALLGGGGVLDLGEAWY